MSYRERQAKKRKTAPNGQDRTSFKPSAVFTPLAGGRDWTVSVAVPGSILANLATANQRMAAPGRIARALAVFAVDEVVVFDDSPPSSRPPPADPAAYTGDTHPCLFLAHILAFLEAPPFMRKALFPLHPNLRLTALLPSLDLPHHPNPRDRLPYREGVTVPGRAARGSLVDVGLPDPVDVAEQIPPKTRVTLSFSPDDDGCRPECVHPSAPRTEGGYYWGYAVRTCASLSAVFTECPFDGGYDVSIGTSERGTPVSKALPQSRRPLDFKHLLVVFGGPRGLEFASMNDEELSGMDVQGPRTKELFDHWVNVLPNQGSRTIRTDEAVFIALAALRGLWDPS